MAEQTIFKRYELKYLISREQRDIIKEAMKEYMIPDAHGRNVTCSMYYDTPDYLLIRRSLEGPVYKEKFRVRSYGVTRDDSMVFLELKKKYDGVVYKRRIGMTQLQAEEYFKDQKGILHNQIEKEIDYCFSHYEKLHATCLLSYQREAFYGKNDHEFRMTFDDTILYRMDHLSLREGIFGRPIIGEDQVLLEVKTGNSIPLWLIKILSQEKIYKTNFSKYGRAYQMMLQEKQDNKKVD